MIRKLIFSLLAAALMGPGIVQAQSFSVGDNVAGLGVGIGGHYNAYRNYSRRTPMLGLYYERGVMELGEGVLGIGGFLGYKSLAYRSRVAGYWNLPGYEYDYRWTYFILGVRGAWHYNAWHGLPELDTYAGLMLSYNSVSYNDRTLYPQGVVSTYSGGSGGLGLTGFLGARYYFTPELGGQVELGYGVSVLSLGLVYKF